MRHSFHFNLTVVTLSLSFATADCSAAVSLPIPTRPTRFPLSRSHDLGSVIAWGYNSSGQTNVPSNLGKCVAIAAGADFSLALRADGTIVAWGGNIFGQCSVPSGFSNVVAITASEFGAAAIRDDGTFVQWGLTGGPPPSWLHDVVQISAAGASHALALRVDGTLVGWGANNEGQIAIPVEARNAVAISAYGAGSAALTADGRVIQWGRRRGTVVSAPGYVAIDRGGDMRLRNNGFVEGMTVQDFVQRDILAVGAGGSVDAAIFTPSRFIWFQDNNLGGFGGRIVPGVVNALAISAGSSHVLGLVGVGSSRPAAAIAKVVNGFVVGIDLMDGGNNYDYVPTVTISGGGGSGATAVANVVDGVVTGFTVTNAGAGYSQFPQVQIGSPWFEPTVAVGSNATRFNITADLVPGDHYVLERSNDLFDWTSFPFTAITNLLVLPLDANSPANFVRLIRNP